MCLELDCLLLREAEPNPPKQSGWILKYWDIFLCDPLPWSHWWLRFYQSNWCATFGPNPILGTEINRTDRDLKPMVLTYCRGDRNFPLYCLKVHWLTSIKLMLDGGTGEKVNRFKTCACVVGSPQIYNVWGKVRIWSLYVVLSSRIR